MNTVLERVADALFPSSHALIGNVKFYPGRNREATAEQFADQLARANSQIAAGEARLFTDIDEDAHVL